MRQIQEEENRWERQALGWGDRQKIENEKPTIERKWRWVEDSALREDKNIMSRLTCIHVSFFNQTIKFNQAYM